MYYHLQSIRMEASCLIPWRTPTCLPCLSFHTALLLQVKGYDATTTANAVDGDAVPVPHFGLALTVKQFHALADQVAKAGIKFIIEPHLRFKGKLVDLVGFAVNKSSYLLRKRTQHTLQSQRPLANAGFRPVEPKPGDSMFVSICYKAWYTDRPT